MEREILNCILYIDVIDSTVLAKTNTLFYDTQVDTSILIFQSLKNHKI
jgi:hypothetical protein